MVLRIGKYLVDTEKFIPKNYAHMKHVVIVVAAGWWCVVAKDENVTFTSHENMMLWYKIFLPKVDNRWKFIGIQTSLYVKASVHWALTKCWALNVIKCIIFSLSACLSDFVRHRHRHRCSHKQNQWILLFFIFFSWAKYLNLHTMWPNVVYIRCAVEEIFQQSFFFFLSFHIMNANNCDFKTFSIWWMKSNSIHSKRP